MKRYSFWVRRRSVPVPTVWSGLLLLVVGAGLVRLSLPAAHRFLAVHRPVGGGVLAVEGWIPDPALAEVVARFETGRYDRIYTLGGPISPGARLAAYGTLADMTWARLRAEGLPADRLVSVPAEEAKRDRTRASARALRRRFEVEGDEVRALDIITVGTHARRTWQGFRSELDPSFAVGVIAVPPDDYDPERWWRSSQGFRAVVYEGLAFVYTRVLGICQPASSVPNSRSASDGPQAPAS